MRKEEEGGKAKVDKKSFVDNLLSFFLAALPAWAFEGYNLFLSFPQVKPHDRLGLLLLLRGWR